MGGLIALVALGFVRSYWIHQGPTGPEGKGFFGGPRYWKPVVHAVLWAVASALVFAGVPFAWVPLTADVAFGIITVAMHYSS